MIVSYGIPLLNTLPHSHHYSPKKGQPRMSYISSPGEAEYLDWKSEKALRELRELSWRESEECGDIYSG
jgi:hypothetical protein